VLVLARVWRFESSSGHHFHYSHSMRIDQKSPEIRAFSLSSAQIYSHWTMEIRELSGNERGEDGEAVAGFDQPGNVAGTQDTIHLRAYFDGRHAGASDRMDTRENGAFHHGTAEVDGRFE